MGRLRTLSPSVAVAPLSTVPRLGANPKQDDKRMHGRPWARLRAQVLERDRFLCQCTECKKHGYVRPADEVDHVVPLSLGGTNALANLQAINRECHARKSRSEAPC